MPPAVQSLDQIIASLDPAYQPSKDLYNQQIAALPGQETDAIAGLDTAKQNSFTDINRQANSKGLAFSGIPSEEQARYLGATYLPAVANLKAGTDKQKFSLQQALAGLTQDETLKAQDTQSAQQKSINDYLNQQQQQQFDLQKVYLQAQLRAQNQTPSPLSQRDVQAGIQQELQKVTGKDGYVAPQDYAAALGDWLSQGLPRAQFNKTFSTYRNPTNKFYDYAVKQAGL